MTNRTTPVTIVGAGPSGMVTSLVLSRHRIPHILVEKYPTMAHTPRAHITNQRTVEIFRDLGIDEEFLSISMPWEQMTNTVWHQSLAGREHGRWRSWGTSPERHGDYLAASPSPLANCGQHIMEPFLFKQVTASPYAEVLLSHELIELDQDEGGVLLTVRPRGTTDSFTIRSDYVVGADGGSGPTARLIGLTYSGEEGIAASATAHFRAELGRYAARRPGTLYWNAAPGSADFRGFGNLVCHQAWHDWALVFSYDRADEERELAPESVMARLRRVIGDDDVEVDIHNISKWTINHVVADSYRVGRVFCMGDAVHRHPPTNGLGLNTSVADAYNLGWKLALVFQGVASAGLLDTYDSERQPIGQQIVDRAFGSIGDMASIANALGFESGQAEADGLAALTKMDEPSPAGNKRRQALHEAIARTDHQFNSLGVEVGYRYRAGAIVADGSPEPQMTRDPELYYHPTTWPGAHLPHAWLDDGSRQVSTYDVCGRGRFTLLTGLGGNGWLEAARQVGEQTGLGIDVRLIGPGLELIDCYGTWDELRGTATSGAVLVRPDLFVGWRADAISADPVRALGSAVRQLLGFSDGD
jgi:2,4-dichlorophenol 6-monooxygenase